MLRDPLIEVYKRPSAGGGGGGGGGGGPGIAPTTVLAESSTIGATTALGGKLANWTLLCTFPRVPE